MNDLLKLALAKKLTKDTKAFRLAPGVHNIDQTFTVTVSGQVTKGADVSYTPTVDIPLIPTLALVLEKAGFMRERAKELLVEAMTEALELGEKGEDFVTEKTKDVDAAIQHVSDITSKLPKKTKQGATKVEIEIDLVVA
jgi:hypothetical protein